MHWPRCLAALFGVLALAGCASVAAGPRQAPNAPYQQGDPREHQRNALTREPAASPSSEPGAAAQHAVPIGARVTTGFRVDWVKPNRPLPDSAARPVLCGGCSVMGIPTAIHSTSNAISPQQERTKPSGPRPCRYGAKF